MEDLVIVETRLGKLRGRIRQSRLTNKRFYSFLGIPFGKPPVGELRFKAPQPFGGWEGVRNALEDGKCSKQSSLFEAFFDTSLASQKTAGDEDCLYLCVYTNELPEKTKPKKPVMVSIHGGGFAGGSGNSNVIGPDFLLEEDVVIVSFNYRCGAFGFLSLDTEEVPGNAGLKDQMLALKWVKDNIDSFGGDPKNVTIFGISGGGASVHYQLLSPLSKGLFQKAIIQSGFAQNLWAFRPSPRKLALKLAKKLGCTSQDSTEVLKFLQSIPSDDIIIAQSDIIKEKEYTKSCCSVFSPSVEVVGLERFLPDTPNNLMKRGEFNKVPTILGVCQNEGSILQAVMMMAALKEEDFPSLVNDNPELLVPPFLNLQPGSPEEKEAIRAISEFYFKGKPLSHNNLFDLVTYHSDVQFNLGYSETRGYLVANSTSPTYSYLFTNHTICIVKLFASSWKTVMPESHGNKSRTLSETETCHGEDGFYIYACPILPELTKEYRQAVQKHIKVWTNFASTGNPNSEEFETKWDPDSQTRPCYMDIGTEWTMKEGVPFAERMDFWQQLKEKYCQC